MKEFREDTDRRRRASQAASELNELVGAANRHQRALEAVLSQCAALQTATGPEQRSLVDKVLQSCAAALDGQYPTEVLESFLPEVAAALDRIERQIKQPKSGVSSNWLATYGAVGLGMGPQEAAALVRGALTPDRIRAAAERTLFQTFPQARLIKHAEADKPWPMASWTYHIDFPNSDGAQLTISRTEDMLGQRLGLAFYKNDKDANDGRRLLDSARLAYRDGEWSEDPNITIQSFFKRLPDVWRRGW